MRRLSRSRYHRAVRHLKSAETRIKIKKIALILNIIMNLGMKVAPCRQGFKYLMVNKDGDIEEKSGCMQMMYV